MQSWLWYAWITRPDGSMSPVYGLLAGTANPTSAAIAQDMTLPSGVKLTIAQAVLSPAIAAPLIALFDKDIRNLDLSQFLPNAPPMEFQFTRIVSAAAFGQGGVRTSANYGMPDPDTIFSSPADLTALLNTMEQQLGLPFRREFATHFGGFDIFEMKPCFENPAPYGMEVLKGEPQPFSDGVRIWRDDATKVEIAHLVLESDGEIVFDTTVLLDKNEDFRDFPIITIPDRMDLRISDPVRGELLFREQNHFIREIVGTIMTPGSGVMLSDGLSKRAASQKALVARASARMTARASHFSTGLDPSKLRSYNKTMGNLLGWSASADRWFPHGVSGELDAIGYFNTLMGEPNVQEAILVDPYFGVDALERVMRFTNGRKLTCVASWTDVDPDTNRDDAALAISRLEAVLNRLGGFIVPHFRFLNLVTGGKERAFHDRYLLLAGTNMTTRVFLLSNSLNGMSLKWSFCMSELGGDALLNAAAYIKGLSDAEDVTGAASPEITFQWPKQADPS